jgi:hypothetical protein
MYLLVYVDAIIIANSFDAAVEALLRDLKSDFALKDLVPLSYFWGIEVTQAASRWHLFKPNQIYLGSTTMRRYALMYLSGYIINKIMRLPASSGDRFFFILQGVLGDLRRESEGLQEQDLFKNSMDTQKLD